MSKTVSWMAFVTSITGVDMAMWLWLTLETSKLGVMLVFLLHLAAVCFSLWVTVSQHAADQRERATR